MSKEASNRFKLWKWPRVSEMLVLGWDSTGPTMYMYTHWFFENPLSIATHRAVNNSLIVRMSKDVSTKIVISTTQKVQGLGIKRGYIKHRC